MRHWMNRSRNSPFSALVSFLNKFTVKQHKQKEGLSNDDSLYSIRVILYYAMPIVLIRPVGIG